MNDYGCSRWLPQQQLAGAGAVARRIIIIVHFLFTLFTTAIQFGKLNIIFILYLNLINFSYGFNKRRIFIITAIYYSVSILIKSSNRLLITNENEE